MNRNPRAGFAKRKHTCFIAVLCAVILVSGCLSIKNPSVSTGLPAKTEAELFVNDPSFITGRLDNGFAYVLKENKEPRKRVSMHLMVRMGSIYETDRQQGLAHYLEHMLFDGSEHFPPGELVKYFQSIGMNFGGDANAHTGFNETVYDVVLPAGDQKNISNGIKVMMDYAKGALLLESEVQKEKNVILAEKRDRDSVDNRTFEATLKFELPGMRISKRLPIGKEETIKAANRDIIKDIYDTWYRPERMVLVVVGDFEAASTKDLITQSFSSLKARAPEPKEPEPGDISHKGLKVFNHYEKENGKTGITIETLIKTDKKPDTLDQRKKDLIEGIVNRMIQYRLDMLIRKPESPVTAASISSGVFLRHVRFASISADANADKWEQGLSFIEQNLRQAIMFGFSESELERVKKDIISGLEQDVKSAPTRNSNELAMAVIGSMAEERRLLSPEAALALFKPFLGTITLDHVNEAVKSVWAADHRLVIVTGNAVLASTDMTAEDRIRKAYEKSAAVTVAKRAEEEKAVFPYLPEPVNPGRIVSRKEYSDLGVMVVQFENGVTLNLKKTDFDANQILFKLNLGGGKSEEPLNRPGLSSVASMLVNESGFGTMDNETLKRALAGKNTQLSFGVSEESFALSGTSVSEEIPLMFQLLQAQILDPGFRKESYDLTMQKMKQNYDEMAKTVSGAEVLYTEPFLSGNDPRFGLPPYETYIKNTIPDVEGWVGKALKTGRIELSVAGDFDMDKMIQNTALYLGSLPSGRVEPVGLKAGKDRLPEFPKGKSQNITIKTQIPKGLVQVVYPTEDFWDISRTRRLSVLGAVFSEKLRNVIREELGAAYSPYAYNHPSLAYPGYGVFKAVVTLAPEQAELVVKKIKTISDDLRKNGITDDEMKRAVDPILTSIRDMRRTNSYWVNSVMAGSARHPERLEWSRTVEADYRAITKDEMKTLAVKYLDNAKAAIVIIVPEKK